MTDFHLEKIAGDVNVLVSGSASRPATYPEIIMWGRLGRIRDWYEAAGDADPNWSELEAILTKQA